VATGSPTALCTCPCCGLAQTIPPLPHRSRAICARCGSTIRHSGGARSAQRTASLALAALILYPLAVTLPVMRIEKFGHARETGILDGTVDLLAAGHLVIGLVVLICSVLVPLAKLLALLVLCSGGGRLGHAHKAMTYRMVELTGRWGMLDVLLVALTVAVLKLGDLVSVRPGPGAVAFATCVGLSLLASASFDPRVIWEGTKR
jgi:paraquat-inducible protein A